MLQSRANWASLSGKIQYHVQHNKYFEHQDSKIYCATNQFPELQFLGPHNKPHGVRGLVKHYQMRFYPKLGHGTCVICSSPLACSICTYMLDQPWVTGMPA